MPKHHLFLPDHEQQQEVSQQQQERLQQRTRKRQKQEVPSTNQEQHSQKKSLHHETNDSPPDASELASGQYNPTEGTTSGASIVAQFQAEKKARQAHELDLRQKELASMQLVREQRRESIKSSTRATYDRYQAIFSWCKEVGYSDDNVIEEKVLRHWTCLTASKEDASNGIVILPVGMRGRRREIDENEQDGERERGGDHSDDSDSDGESDSDGHVSDNIEGHRDRRLASNDAPSLSMVKLHASAIGELYRQQRSDPDNKVMYRCLDRKPMEYLRDLIASYERRMSVTKRATDTDQGSVSFVEEDPLENTKMIMVHFWHHNIQGEKSKSTRVITGLRHRLDAAFRFFMMCRSETTRRARLIDLFGQNVTRPTRQDEEKKFVLGVVLMTRQGKMNKDGKIRYNVVVRNSDVEACPVGALAFYLLEYWSPTSSSSAPPPSLDDRDWVNYHLLSKSTTRTSELRYTSQYTQTRTVLDDLNIAVKGKATHLSRRLGAFLARLTGATHEDISKHGGWATNRLITHYLDGVDASVALQMSGVENGRTDSFWLARNIIPDLELQRMVFPFIESACSNPEDKKHYDRYWIQTIDNIMLDRSIYYGRQQQQEVKVDIKNKTVRRVLADETISRRRHLSLLAHLRKVILQDAAVMLLADNKSSRHPIFKREVFRSPEFLAFKNLMAETLSNVSFRPTNKAAVPPVIQRHMEAVNVLMSQQTSRQQAMTTKIAKIADTIDRLQADQGRRALHTEQRNQYVLEGVAQGMGKMNDKIDTLIRSMATSLSDAADRMTSIAQAQEPDGTSIGERPLVPLLGQSSIGPEEPKASISGSRLPIIEGSSSSAHPPPIVHARGVDGSDRSAESQDKILAVSVAIARYRREIGEVDPPMPRHMPLCTLVPRPNTLEGIWQEWFYGINGKPSIMMMDSWYSTLWRSEKNSVNPDGKNGYAGLYLFKKTIVNSVLRYIPDGVPIDMTMIERALQDFQEMLKEDYNSCSIALYYKLLPKKVSKRFGSIEEKGRGKGKRKAKEPKEP